MFEPFRTVGFRLAFSLSLSFTTLCLGLFGFVYWQTTRFEIRRTDSFLVAEIGRLSRQPDADIIASVGARQTEGLHRLTVAALFLPDGVVISGNLDQVPRRLLPDGRPHSVEVPRPEFGGERTQLVRTVSGALPGGDILVIGRSLDELVELRQVLARALLLGVIPAVLLTLALSVLVSWRTLRQVRATDKALDRIIQGELSERLPTRGTSDSFDHLVRSVNGMLDKIAILLEELRDVGNNIAHDLRTPLARIRARLERCREQGFAAQNLVEVLDQAIAELDHTADIITALLRIGEIEDHQRRSGFTAVSVASLLEDLFEVYQPVAEQRTIALLSQVDPTMMVRGDWDLLTEALSNLIENAIKFTPGGGSVRLMGYHDGRGAIIRVADTGPGITKEEQEVVFSRFSRGKQSGNVTGSGLGLSLVRAICRLHGFTVDVVEGPPGCIIEILCGVAARELKGLPALDPDRKWSGRQSATGYPDRSIQG
jgi:signal transduction histidine kinase